jgi:hypothetical protein
LQIIQIHSPRKEIKKKKEKEEKLNRESGNPLHTHTHTHTHTLSLSLSLSLSFLSSLLSPFIKVIDYQTTIRAHENAGKYNVNY